MAPRSAHAALAQLIDLPHHVYWELLPAPANSASLTAVPVVGHRQVTGAYLIDLARQHGGNLVTFDKAMLPLAAAVDKQAPGRVVVIA